MNDAFTRTLAAALAALILLAPAPSPWRGGLGRGDEPSLCSALTNTSSAPNPASCRIHNLLPSGVANVGSGTLVDVRSDGSRGLVLTCAHLFADGTGRVVVEFPEGPTHGALLVAIDQNADLAALEIANPPPAPVSVNLQSTTLSTLRACGYGGNGAYRCVSGSVLGFSERPGQQSLRIAGAVRSGDSGGGVFDDRGRLCAVVWGEADGVTYASTGGPLQRFLQPLLASSRAPQVGSTVAGATTCPGGRCPWVQPEASGGAPAGRSPAASGGSGGNGGGLLPWRPLAPANGCDCSDQLAAIAQRLEGLEQSRAAGGDRGASWPSGFGGTARAAAVLATTALGLSGPAGWGVVAAASIGGWLVGRRVKTKARGASREAREKIGEQQLAPHAPRLAPHQEATAAAAGGFQPDGEAAEPIELHQPIERDDVEARQLLRLSQLEGRDPLQDALAGRLALDRLDAFAESSADPQRQTWADGLRRELRERFNEVAPTKFQVNADCGVRSAE